MPKQATKKKSNDEGPDKEERKRSRKSSSPSSSRVADSGKRRRKQRKKEERLKRRQQKHEEQQKSIQKIVDLATGKLKEEIEKWKDGSHPDLSKSLRSIREQKVREDRCIICMEGGDDGGSKVDLFSACCGQAYHASCYFQQLTWAQKKTSGTNNNIGKCGVCRQALPQIDASICMPAKSRRSSWNGVDDFHLPSADRSNAINNGLHNSFGSGGVMGDWRNYSLSSSSSDSSSDSSSSDSSSSSSDDVDSDDSSEDSDSGESNNSTTTANRAMVDPSSDSGNGPDVENEVILHNEYDSSDESSSSSSSSSSSDSSYDSDDNNHAESMSGSTRSLRYDSLDRLSRTVSSVSSLDRWYQRDRIEAMHSSMPSRRRRRRIRSRS